MMYESIAYVLRRDELNDAKTWVGIGRKTYRYRQTAERHAHAIGRSEVQSGAALEYRAEVTEIPDEPKSRVSDAHKAANARYDKTNTKQIALKLNRHTDADLIFWLDRQPNVQGTIKELVRAAIKREYEEWLETDEGKDYLDWIAIDNHLERNWGSNEDYEDEEDDWLVRTEREQKMYEELLKEQQRAERKGLAGWYGWARCDGRDVDRKRYATEREATEHAQEVAHRLRAEGRECQELWEECDEQGIPVSLSDKG